MGLSKFEMDHVT